MYGVDNSKKKDLESSKLMQEAGAKQTPSSSFSYNHYQESDAVKQAQEQLKNQQANKPGAYQSNPYKEGDAVKQAYQQLQQQLSGKPGEFQHEPYKESDAVKQAYQQLQQQLAGKPGAYESSWQTQLNDTLNQILNREKFSYDMNADALYHQYKDQYTTQGQMAMMDTMGQAAAMTGGYGNSYAQAAGQQIYQGYLQQLNSKIPELYQLALNRYNMEGEDLRSQYSMMNAQEQLDYGRYRDTMSDWNTALDRAQSQYNAERDYDYNRWSGDRNFAYGQHRDTVSDYNQALDRAQSQYNAERDYDYGRWVDDRNFGYSQYRDTVSDYNQALDRAQSQYNAERDYDYGKWVDDRNFGYGQFTDDRNFNYQQQINDRNFNYQQQIDDRNYQYQVDRDKIQDSQWQAEFDEAIRQFNILNPQVAPVIGGGGGGNPKPTSTYKGGKTYNHVKQDFITGTTSGMSVDERNGILNDAVKAGVISNSEAKKIANIYNKPNKKYTAADQMWDRHS